jgi:hypothetical protein
LQRIHNFVIQDAYSTRGNRAHGQFLLAGQAQLPYNQDIQRRLKRLGYRERNWHTAARQRQYKHIRTASIAREQLCQVLARFGTVTKTADHSISPQGTLLTHDQLAIRDGHHHLRGCRVERIAQVQLGHAAAGRDTLRDHRAGRM